jgi:DNA-binding NarL/FixJ family response regulator
VKRDIHIIIAEPAAMVFEGLAAIFLKSGLKPLISKADTLDEILQLHLKRPGDIVIISPTLIQNNVKSYQTLRNQFENTHWIGVVYAYSDPNLLLLFDAVITISDTSEIIVAIVSKMLNTINPKEPDVLSDREIEVLKLLASGLANKEIADKLNISINTVITHRKNISQKTGIKSVSGLTIYAVVKKLVTLENLFE